MLLLSRRVVSAAAARALPQRTQFAARFYAADASPEDAEPDAKEESLVLRSLRSKSTATAGSATSARRAYNSKSVQSSSVPPELAVYGNATMIYNDPDNSTESKSANGDATIVPDWTNSFYGISAQPVSKEQFKNLVTPLDVADIEVKPDGILYLPEIKYRRKLNETFGPMGWGLIPKGEAVVGSSIVTREYALIVDGRFVSQAQGENNYFGPEQLPSAVEGCKSNALMRCCKDLGIGSELWDPQFLRWFRKTHIEEVWAEHMVTKKKKTLYFKKGVVQIAYPYKSIK
ncbi:hypothetical protein E4U17_001782 [Claviceps sp. LM77 group G4]|nr:hypothetical protein E4U17_001782 [Claviceps sp. LM77 group G4]KAG6071408.1 hypothetical protein E4U33_003716 [Claviceps sp. LM78 group G4]KAG6080894.1 hypothetical protein E4U16_008052 [Claviceps sp. LM84 group G4]